MENKEFKNIGGGDDSPSQRSRWTRPTGSWKKFNWV